MPQCAIDVSTGHDPDTDTAGTESPKHKGLRPTTADRGAGARRANLDRKDERRTSERATLPGGEPDANVRESREAPRASAKAPAEARNQKRKRAHPPTRLGLGAAQERRVGT